MTASSQSKPREIEAAGPVQGSAWIGWLPPAVLPLIAVFYRNVLPSWAFMWTLSFAIFIGRVARALNAFEFWVPRPSFLEGRGF
jgi:hypothetical protein